MLLRFNWQAKFRPVSAPPPALDNYGNLEYTHKKGPIRIDPFGRINGDALLWAFRCRAGLEDIIDQIYGVADVYLAIGIGISLLYA